MAKGDEDSDLKRKKIDLWNGQVAMGGERGEGSWQRRKISKEEKGKVRGE